MKKLFFLISIAIGSHSFAQNSDKLVTAKPTDVTIYQQGAFVTRTLSTNLQKGLQKITIIGLPRNIEQNTLFASAPEGVKIVSFAKVNAKLTPQMTKTIAAQADSVQEFAYLSSKLKLHRNAYNNEYNLINENKNLAGTNGVKADELEKVANLYRRKLRELADLMHNLDRELAEISTKKSEVSRRQQQNVNNFSNQVSAVELTIKSEKTQTSKLNIKYFLSSASWSPNYNFRFNGLNEPCYFEANAAISNYSNDDWEDVKITLSTATPQKRLSPEAFQTWFVNQGNISRGKSSYEMNMTSNQISEKRNFKADKAGADFTNETSTEMTVTYELQDPISLTTQSQTAFVEIKSITTNPSFKHIVNLGSCDDTYLTANITEWQKWRLLSGPIQIYNYGELNGTASFDTYLLSDTMQIPLGIDRNVVIKYKTIVDKREKSFMSSNYSHEFRFEISVKNNNSRAINIEMIDQVPVSRSEKIKIEINEISGAEYEAEIGKITWKLEIPANTGEKRNLGFTAKYPKSETFNINGYRNRRF
jgi:uncharacterized protein (TIGR02231 family)